MATDELQSFLFDGRSHPLTATVAAWLCASRRFREFVAANQTKIRKKLRTAQEPETLRGLALELETAYLLLRERFLSLLYEPQHDEHARCPDFAVSFTARCVFMVEVTRMGTNKPAKQPGVLEHGRATQSPHSTRTGQRLVDRFADTLCSKLGQLLPQRSNVLIVGVDGPPPADPDLHEAMLSVQLRAEGNDSTVVHRHGFRDRAEFFRHYQRLSALLVRGTPLQPGERAVVWINPQARHPLPAKLRTALSSSHTL
jgi:hypothetical protein